MASNWILRHFRGATSKTTQSTNRLNDSAITADNLSHKMEQLLHSELLLLAFSICNVISNSIRSETTVALALRELGSRCGTAVRRTSRSQCRSFPARPISNHAPGSTRPALNIGHITPRPTPHNSKLWLISPPVSQDVIERQELHTYLQ